MLRTSGMFGVIERNIRIGQHHLGPRIGVVGGERSAERGRDMAGVPLEKDGLFQPVDQVMSGLGGTNRKAIRRIGRFSR